MIDKMTSSNEYISRDTGPLCGEFIVHRWIPLTKVSDTKLWCFPCAWTNSWDLRRLRARYDVTVIELVNWVRDHYSTTYVSQIFTIDIPLLTRKGQMRGFFCEIKIWYMFNPVITMLFVVLSCIMGWIESPCHAIEWRNRAFLSLFIEKYFENVLI